MAATGPARPCGFSLFGALGRIHLIGPFGRPESGRKSCIAAAHSVRCSATRAPDFPQPGRAFAARPAALVGFDPSQCCSCHAGKAVRHPHRLAHLPFPVHPSRPIFAGRSIATKPQIHPRSKGDRPRMPQRGSWALSWRAIRALPVPPLADRQGRYCLGLGLFQAFGHRLVRSRGLGCRPRGPSASGNRFRLLSARGFCWRHMPGNAAAKQLPRTIGVSANPSAY
jgi:hypothetical protein